MQEISRAKEVDYQVNRWLHHKFKSRKERKILQNWKKPLPLHSQMYRGVEQLVARRAHNPEAGGSSPPPATKTNGESWLSVCFCIGGGREPEVRTDARSESRGCLQTMPRKKEEKQIACNLINPPPATKKGETKMFLLFSYRRDNTRPHPDAPP